MLLVAVCVLALAKFTRAALAMLSIVFAAIWLAGSRAVFLALPFTIGAAWSMRIVSRSLFSEAIFFWRYHLPGDRDGADRRFGRY
jgi:hypothetical protein